MRAITGNFSNLQFGMTTALPGGAPVGGAKNITNLVLSSDNRLVARPGIVARKYTHNFQVHATDSFFAFPAGERVYAFNVVRDLRLLTLNDANSNAVPHNDAPFVGALPVGDAIMLLTSKQWELSLGKYWQAKNALGEVVTSDPGTRATVQVLQGVPETTYTLSVYNPSTRATVTGTYSTPRATLDEGLNLQGIDVVIPDPSGQRVSGRIYLGPTRLEGNELVFPLQSTAGSSYDMARFDNLSGTQLAPYVKNGVLRIPVGTNTGTRTWQATDVNQVHWAEGSWIANVANPAYSSQVATRQAEWTKRRNEYALDALKKTSLASIAVGLAHSLASQGVHARAVNTVVVLWGLEASQQVTIADTATGSTLRAVHQEAASTGDLPPTADHGHTVMVNQVPFMFLDGKWREAVSTPVVGTPPFVGLLDDGETTPSFKPTGWNWEPPTVGNQTTLSPVVGTHRFVGAATLAGRLIVATTRGLFVSAAGSPSSFFPSSLAAPREDDGFFIPCTTSVSEEVRAITVWNEQVLVATTQQILACSIAGSASSRRRLIRTYSSHQRQQLFTTIKGVVHFIEGQPPWLLSPSAEGSIFTASPLVPQYTSWAGTTTMSMSSRGDCLLVNTYRGDLAYYVDLKREIPFISTFQSALGLRASWMFLGGSIWWFNRETSHTTWNTGAFPVTGTTAHDWVGFLDSREKQPIPGVVSHFWDISSTTIQGAATILPVDPPVGTGGSSPLSGNLGYFYVAPFERSITLHPPAQYQTYTPAGKYTFRGVEAVINGVGVVYSASSVSSSLPPREILWKKGASRWTPPATHPTKYQLCPVNRQGEFEVTIRSPETFTAAWQPWELHTINYQVFAYGAETPGPS